MSLNLASIAKAVRVSLGLRTSEPDNAVLCYAVIDQNGAIIAKGIGGILVKGDGTPYDTGNSFAAPTITGGLTASGSASNDFSGSTGTFKTSTGATTIGGAATVTGALTLSAGFIGSVQSLSGAGAVNLTTLTTKLTTTGSGQALTLADGTNGQVKNIVHAVDGGSAVLTPTTKTGFTTITFTAVGDSCKLVFFTTQGWMLVGTPTAAAA